VAAGVRFSLNRNYLIATMAAEGSRVIVCRPGALSKQRTSPGQGFPLFVPMPPAAGIDCPEADHAPDLARSMRLRVRAKLALPGGHLPSDSAAVRS